MLLLPVAYTDVDIFRIIPFPIFFPREVENGYTHVAVLTSRLGRFCFFSPFFLPFFSSSVFVSMAALGKK